MPCHAWKYVTTVISGGVDISEAFVCHLLQQMSSNWGSQKSPQSLVSHEPTTCFSVFNIFLTQWIMIILSSKPDNFESPNSLNLSFTNIWSLHFNFVECESFLESNSPNILAPCETNLDDSINSGKFSVRGYLSLIRKDTITHIHSLAVYVEQGIYFA